MPEDKKRSLTVEYISQAMDQAGVGARHKGRPAPAGGGGYLDNCSKTETDLVANDPRIVELSKIGVSAVLQQVARSIGYDNFMSMWRIVDSNQPTGSDRSISVSFMRFRAYTKHQRNKMIVTLSEGKIPTREIKQAVLEATGEKLSSRHIRRISTKTRT